MSFKHYTISDLIEGLTKEMEENGNLPVFLSIDEEGNAFHPVGEHIIEKTAEREGQTVTPFCFDNEEGKERLIIFPG